MIKAGIVGAAGYAGINLISLLLRHPETKIIWISSEAAHVGKKISELFPHFLGETELVIKEKGEASEVDVVFFATPHCLAMRLVPSVLSSGAKVIDLSADYRFCEVGIFKKWYKVDHASPNLLGETVYGLPELHKEKIKSSKLVGNPGCYPTAAILGAAPLVKEDLIDKESLIFDAKSGVSGAGRTPMEATHFPECNEGVSAYTPLTHRHTGEIEQELGTKVIFVPHLIPMTRGILTTIYANSKIKIQSSKLMKIYQDFYKDAPFVRILEDTLPSTKYVYGTNFCDIAVRVNEEGNKIIVLSAIDNLIKGAAGQAIQNMNLMFNLPEKMGLENIGVYP